MRTKLSIIVAIAAGGMFLAGCGTSTSPAGDSSTTGSSGNAGGTAVTIKPSCDLVSAATVNTALGTNVTAPKATTSGDDIVVCTYSPASGSGTVILRMQVGMSQSTFTTARGVSDKNGIPTADYPGFADQAYTSTISAGSHVTNTLVALKGTVQVLVSSAASFDQEKALEQQVFAKLLST